MAMKAKRLKNPLGFTPWPVTILAVLVYVGLFTGLLYVHHVVPSAPKDDSPKDGINITEAWLDLQHLSAKHHPYNSQQNDNVRNWLLNRIDDILDDNNIKYETRSNDLTASHKHKSPSPVIIFNDLTSNVTLAGDDSYLSVYFEGTNIIVYIRGSYDDDDDWWDDPDPDTASPTNSRGVLVNAHYDSVATGYGATDDGVGVVTILQLIKYFTTPGNQPRRGVVALLNNGEEDFLNGAYAFTQARISKFPNVFLNLEGAGAGGRATLFRTTDAEVTDSYGKVPYPFGSVSSNDGFDKGLVKSQTDYVVFNGVMGFRGLDVAFMAPRARYHTSEDSARNTGKDSLWHMLSAALPITKDLASRPRFDFEPDEGTDSVWFDMFGRGFGLVNMPTMFALSVILLVVAPIALAIMYTVLKRQDKWYLFARAQKTDPRDPHSPDDETTVSFKGWDGFFRYPIAFIFASFATVALALVVMKINPYIIYSSEYAVWSMTLSAWFVVAWFLLKGADYMRPSALHRAHSFGWIFVLFWVILVAVTVAENNFKIRGAYSLVIYFAAIFVAISISYVEFFALPSKSSYMQRITRIDERERTERDENDQGSPSQRRHSGSRSRPASSRQTQGRDRQEPTETTSLLSKTDTRRQSRSEAVDEEDESLPREMKAGYYDEQKWSGPLPTWLWTIQFLATAPIVIILLGQEALLFTSALHQTPADGSSVMIVYLGIAILSIFILIPVSPFLHRFSSEIPTFLFFIVVGTLLYNLLAFPFSEQNKLKVFFQQELDLDSGINKVSLTGIDGYTQKIIAELPSAAGQDIQCSRPSLKSRNSLKKCSWLGLAPNTVPEIPGQTGTAPSSELPPQLRYASWLKLKAKRVNETANEAVFKLSGRNTRACKLLFDTPITEFIVKGGANSSFSRVPKNGATEVRLWSREWERKWTVHVKWNNTSEDDERQSKKPQGLDGRAVCLWSDINEPGVIPAFDEVQHNMPVWSIVTKYADGLVEGSKAFML